MQVGSVFTEGTPDYSPPAVEVNNDFITQK